MPTSLAFRTPVGGVSIPAGQSKELGSVDVHQFSKIRVIADERIGSATGINIRLTVTEGSELVAQLDTFSLAPHSQVTRVYDVPAKKLTVFADAVGGGGGNDALVHSWREANDNLTRSEVRVSPHNDVIAMMLLATSRLWVARAVR